MPKTNANGYLIKNNYLVFFLVIMFASPMSYASKQNYWLKRKGVVYEGRYIIPLAALVPIIIHSDTVGFKQYLLSEIITASATEALKHTIKEKRPIGNCRDSFPSGHASGIFAASSFVQFRYGIKESIPFYLASSIVAYQRVYSKGHYVHDVIAGALMGGIVSYLSTTPFKEGNTNIYFDGKAAGIIYRKIFD